LKNVLIINGHQKYEGVAEGNLTNEVINKAKEFFSNNDYEVKQTHIEQGLDKSCLKIRSRPFNILPTDPVSNPDF